MLNILLELEKKLCDANFFLALVCGTHPQKKRPTGAILVHRRLMIHTIYLYSCRPYLRLRPAIPPLADSKPLWAKNPIAA